MKKLSALGTAVLVALAIGCARGDGAITAKVKSQLIGDSMVQARGIDVDTKDRVVTLAGTVKTQAAKYKAVEIARATEGVAEVVDNLVVESGEAAGGAPSGESVGQAVDDAALTAKIKSRLLADPLVGGLKVDVDTRDGVVTLTSDSMKSQAEIDQAIRLARGVEGVRDVRANLTTRSS